MVNVNFFGGPGLSKSTTAAGLFYTMKRNHEKVEYISEYAKDLTYGLDSVRLSDPLHVVAEQHHRLHRINGQVDYLIHDSPFLLGLAYVGESIPAYEFKNLVLTMFNQYDNVNILLTRNIEDHPYQEYGRSQTLEEAIQKDVEVKAILDENAVPYYEVLVNEDTVSAVLQILKEHYDSN